MVAALVAYVSSGPLGRVSNGKERGGGERVTREDFGDGVAVCVYDLDRLLVSDGERV